MKKTRPALKLMTCCLALALLNGCYMYLPHHKMKIVDRTDALPFTLVGGIAPIQLYCKRFNAPAGAAWTQFAEVESTFSALDKKGFLFTLGQESAPVPTGCWSELNNTNPTKNWTTLVRVGTDGSFGTLGKKGMTCIGALVDVGKVGGWDDCMRYDSSNQPVDTVQLFAKN